MTSLGGEGPLEEPLMIDEISQGEIHGARELGALSLASFEEEVNEVEIEELSSAAQGTSVEESALARNYSIPAVKWQRRQLMRKLQARSMPHAIYNGYRLRLISTNYRYEILTPLTKKQGQILKMIALGFNKKEIGQTMGITEATVKWHSTGIREKLAAKNLSHAVTRAIQAGALETQDEVEEKFRQFRELLARACDILEDLMIEATILRAGNDVSVPDIGEEMPVL